VSGTDRRLNTAAWRATREFVKARDRYVCQINGPGCMRYANQVDHVVARADGGDCYDLANLRAACSHCNSSGGAQRTNARRYRTTVADYVTRL
jgi:5-methylcytosine-specific restriction enzyme A